MSLRLLTLATGVSMVAAWTGRPAPSSPAPDASYVADMTGAQEVPSNNSKGTGTATLSIDGTSLKYSVEVHDLSGAPTMAHIHVGANGVNGPPVYTFAIAPGAGMSGDIAEGSIDLTKDASAGVSGDSLRTLLNNGNAYINVHTKNFPGGEIRGQVMKKM